MAGNVTVAAITSQSGGRAWTMEGGGAVVDRTRGPVHGVAFCSLSLSPAPPRLFCVQAKAQFASRSWAGQGSRHTVINRETKQP